MSCLNLPPSAARGGRHHSLTEATVWEPWLFHNTCSPPSLTTTTVGSPVGSCGYVLHVGVLALKSVIMHGWAHIAASYLSVCILQVKP